MAWQNHIFLIEIRTSEIMLKPSMNGETEYMIKFNRTHYYPNHFYENDISPSKLKVTNAEKIEVLN